MRIGVLSNMRAGGGSKGTSKVLEHLSRRPDIVHCQTDSGHHVPEAIREMAEAGVRILVINGGDGTLQRALTEVMCPASPFGTEARDLPMIAPLRTGRTSMSAYDIGCPRDPRVAIDRLVARAKGGRMQEWVVPRAALRMQLDPDGVDHWGTFFGVGVIYRGTLMTHRYFPKGKAQGAFGSTMVTAGLIARMLTGRAPVDPHAEGNPLRVDRIEAVLDGQPLDPGGGFQLLLGTTMHRLIGGIRPFWGKGPGGIRFTAIRPGCFRRPQELARVLRGRMPTSESDDLYVSRNLEKVELTLDCGISLDGEMFDPRPGRRAKLTADHRVRFLSTR